MNCQRVTNLLSAYVDGELTGVEMLEIRRHVSGCPDCAEEYQAVLFTKHAVARLASVAPREDFVLRLIGNLDEVQISPYQRIFNNFARFAHRRFSPVAAALAASGLAMVVLSAGGVMDGLGTPDSGIVASAPFENRAASVSFLPEVHTSPDSMASSRPLMVASDATSVTHARIEFVSLNHAR